MTSFIRVSVFLIIVLASQQSSAVTVTVDPGGEGDALDLASALLLVSTGDVIEFVDGDHHVNVDLDFSHLGLVFRSASGDPEACRLVADFQGRTLAFFHSSDVPVEFHDLTIVELMISITMCPYGFYDCRLERAILDAREHSGSITGCTFDFSTLWICDGPLVISSADFSNYSWISKCLGSSGETPTVHLELSECDLSDNSFVNINNFEGSVRLENCSLTGRTGFTILELGGYWSGTLTIVSSLIANNYCEYRAPIALRSSPTAVVSIVDSSLINNQSDGLTAGIMTYAPCTVECLNTDFIGNTAADDYHDAYIATGATLHLNCCRIDEENVGGPGSVIVVNEDCPTGNESMSWGGVKAGYHR